MGGRFPVANPRLTPYVELRFARPLHCGRAAHGLSDKESVMNRILCLGLFAMAAFTFASSVRADEATDKAAEELLLAMKADKVMMQSIDQVLEALALSRPFAFHRENDSLIVIGDAHMN